MSLDFAEVLGEFLSELITHHNYQPPIFLAAIGANGCLFYTRYISRDDGGFNCEILAQHNEGPGLQCPINLLFLETGTGRLARVTVENENQRTFQIQ